MGYRQAETPRPQPIYSISIPHPPSIHIIEYHFLADHSLPPQLSRRKLCIKSLIHVAQFQSNRIDHVTQLQNDMINHITQIYSDVSFHVTQQKSDMNDHVTELQCDIVWYGMVLCSWVM